MLLKDLSEKKEEKENTKHFLTDIERDTINNEHFRQVVYTASSIQLVLMSIPPKESIGEEVHKISDQFIRVEAGVGYLSIEGVDKQEIKDGSAFVIPKGTKHNIMNISEKEDLKIYSLYSPPHHAKGVLHKTKEESMESEEHFDGDTDT